MRWNNQIIAITCAHIAFHRTDGRAETTPVSPYSANRFQTRYGHVNNADVSAWIGGHQIIADAEHEFVAFRIDDIAIAVEPLWIDLRNAINFA